MLIGWRPATSGLLAALTLTTEVPAQVPSLPVLQNAFSSPGFAVAANVGGGSGQTFYGAAAGWGMGRIATLSISGAAGAERSNGETRGAYGGRLAARVWSNDALGVGAFVGFGGAPRTRSDSIVTNPAQAMVPLGATVAYRRALGNVRGFAVYLSPFYQWTRSDSGDGTVNSSAFRVSAGLDFAFSPSFGLTFGGEFGGSQDDDRSGLIGGALSFVPGRRQ